jgi:hypothetical protein
LLESHSEGELEKTLERFVLADRRAKSSSLGAGIAYDLAVLGWASGSTGT